MITPDKEWYTWDDEDLLISVRIQPRAARDRFVAPYGSQYKISIVAPPVDGKANAHLCRFLAKSFCVPGGQVTIESGAHAKTKRIRIRRPQRFPVPIGGPRT